MSDLKVATTYEEESGAIYQHFGHCKSFKIFHVSGKEITSAAVVSSGTYGHGGLATFLKNMGVEVLICGGIGGGAQNALKSAGIELYGGVNGNADLLAAFDVSLQIIHAVDVQLGVGGQNEDGGVQIFNKYEIVLCKLELGGVQNRGD